MKKVYVKIKLDDNHFQEIELDIFNEEKSKELKELLEKNGLNILSVIISR
jgi:hypothetical protein